MPEAKEGKTLEAGHVVAGKYVVVRLIGQGGMGQVYEARHVRLDQRVAVKVLRADAHTTAELVDRFEREARAVAKLSNPNVARVFDVDVLPDGTPFMVLEYLNGVDLATALETARLPLGEAVDVIRAACAGMAEAHALGIVHRDLKPENLFLHEVGGKRVVKVLDFGISKLLADEDVGVTQTQLSLGTPLYMSPEHVRSTKHVDARTDVWSLGVILYELVTGRTPFQGETATGVAAAIAADPVPPPGEFVRGLDPGLEAVMLKALEKRADARFQSVEAFSRALEPHGGAGAPSRPLEAKERAERTELAPTLVATHTSFGRSATARASSRVPWVVGGGVIALALGAGAVFLARKPPPAVPAEAATAASSVAATPPEVPVPEDPPPSAAPPPATSAPVPPPSATSEPKKVTPVRRKIAAPAPVARPRPSKPPAESGSNPQRL